MFGIITVLRPSVSPRGSRSGISSVPECFRLMRFLPASPFRSGAFLDSPGPLGTGVLCAGPCSGNIIPLGHKQ
jgi:hypothetical protein